MKDDRRKLALTDSEAALRQVLLELDDLGKVERYLNGENRTAKAKNE
jgi:hypothetical protein